MHWAFGPIRIKLNSVVSLSRGKRLVRSQLSLDQGYPVYQNSRTPLGYYTDYNRTEDTTFVICAGAAGEVCYSKHRFWAADDVFSLESNGLVSDRFMYHLLSNRQEWLKSQVRKASVPRLSKIVLENIIFVFPPLATQNRIVSILDKFDTLTNDLTQGLPKEIALRQKQYEYFRDQLLQFALPRTTQQKHP